MVEYIKLKNKNNEEKKKKLTWGKALLITFILFLVISFIEGLVFNLTPKIEVIPIQGEITSFSTPTSLFSGETVNARDVSKEIYRAANDNSVKAILLDINSPGGSPVASAEISKAIDFAKKKKPVYSVIEDLGASGAYWIASSTNKIYASPMSLVGSIGVTSAGLSFQNFIKRYNITYRRLVAGKYKDMGTPFRNMTPEEKKIFQGMLNDIYYKFINHVAKERNLSFNYTKSIANGRIYLGDEALKLHLIDSYGYYNNVVNILKNKTKASLVVTYKYKSNMLEQLLGVMTNIGNPLTSYNHQFKIELN